MDLKELIEFCRDKNLYIQTHNFPDPDAIASAFGLQKIFEHFGVPSKLCYVGRIDRVNTKKMTELCSIEILSYDELEDSMQEDDVIICVDSQKGAGNILDLKGREIACIDHHPYIEVEGLLFHEVRRVGACATIVAGYFEEFSIEPDIITATALLYGIKNDTLNFTRGVQEEDVHIFAWLLPRVDQQILTKLEHDSMEYDDLRAYGSAIQNIEVYGNLGIAMIPFSCPDALVATISDFILSLNAVEVAVVYAKREDGIKFSARSEVPDKVNAGELLANVLAGYGDGGGHAFMAGGLIPAKNVEKLGKAPDEKLRELIVAKLK